MDTTAHYLSGALATGTSPWTPADLSAMREARVLARRGAGRTWTNPMVGAVVVTDGRVVGSGYHQRAGEAHAETLALAEAGERARGATLYVNLEPCAHEGRTPPCVHGIRDAGIARVVMPAPDPDARVSGQGAEWLRAQGIRVDVGCDAAAAILDNHGYYHDRLGLGAIVTLKLATSRDGMVARARGQRDTVTGHAAQLDVHELRAAHDAIAIGIQTARIDRPRLDCRLVPGGVDRDPVVVVFDTNLSLAGDAAWPGAGREFIVVAAHTADAARMRAIEARGGRVIRCATAQGRIDVRGAVEQLAQLGLARILVEGGADLASSFIEAGVWDAFWHYRSGERFGPSGVRAPASPIGLVVDEIALGNDARTRIVRDASWHRLQSRLSTCANGPRKGTNGVHGNR